MLKDFFNIKKKKNKNSDVSSNSSLSSQQSSSSNKSSSSISSNSTTSTLSKNSSNWNGMIQGYRQPKTPERVNLNLDNNNSILNSSFTTKFDQVEQTNIDFPNLVIFKDANTQTIASYETCSMINLNEINHSNSNKNNIRIKKSKLKIILYIISLILFIYSMIILLVIYSPFLQSSILYMNIFKWPGDLLNLKKFGLCNARNIEITTEDGILLKGWHLLPPGLNSHLSADSSYNTNDMNDINYNKEILNNKNNYYDVILANSARIVVYFHGNAMTRGFPYRVELIKHLSSQLNAHVIAIDYRGFGDSEGIPTEEGTYKDAKAVITWINDRVISKNLNNATGYFDEINNNDNNDNNVDVELKTCINNIQKQPFLYVYGHSLGSAVSTGLVSNMSKGAISGLILDSPFSSFYDVALSHPLARPIVKLFPIIKDLMKNNLIIKYPTLEKIKTIETDVLILHGYNDIVIPIEQSQAIYRSKLSHEFLKKQNNSNNNSNNYNINLIEVEWASHSQVFRTREWMKEVPGFILNIENNYKYKKRN